MRELVAADIGGTHARFAIATIGEGRVVELGPALTLRTAEHASLETAWHVLQERIGRRLPRFAAFAVASPVDGAGSVLKFTNNPWVIQPALIDDRLGLDGHILINDFGAVAHAVAHLDGHGFDHLAGPDRALPPQGQISIVGPGTGLGVALLMRRAGGYDVIETEGGHIDFAPLDAVEDAILARLRARHMRVSAERVAAGPGLAAIYETLAAIEGRAVAHLDDATLWTRALDGGDDLAFAAFERFCLILGAVAGDIVLTHGAKALVIAGGLGQRIAPALRRSGFARRFAAKGRFQAHMEAIPVKLITHPQPGLLGAAAAFAQTGAG